MKIDPNRIVKCLTFFPSQSKRSVKFYSAHPMSQSPQFLKHINNHTTFVRLILSSSMAWKLKVSEGFSYLAEGNNKKLDSHLYAIQSATYDIPLVLVSWAILDIRVKIHFALVP
jgi:hypothetical protein